MKRFKHIFCNLFLIPVFFSIFSCNDNSLESNLPYEERLVVRGMLDAGEIIEVYFAKTLSPNEAYDTSKANLSDVTAYIKKGEFKDTLIYTGAGIYRTKTMIAENGETFELFASWKDKKVYANTRVPNTATFQNGRIFSEITNGDTSFFIEGLLTPREGAVYGAVWAIINNQPGFYLEDSILSELHREQDKDLQNRLKLKTRNFSKQLYEQWKNSFYIRINAFDEEFYNFFLTQDANNAANNIFSQTGINLRWNVEGDAIGIFIGKSDYLIKVF